jgi:hypothetical protein
MHSSPGKKLEHSIESLFTIISSGIGAEMVSPVCMRMDTISIGIYLGSFMGFG